ncbi:MAG TPA: radical SAM protein [Sphingopyxis sp.]|nr:radical SAM protein [Sphingopyxis sp.]HMP43855.1 radical SAM protein [Sphingopyxis sp.]HMQ19695.1 radical SAM protein [Sphingopyxis sp.]
MIAPHVSSGLPTRARAIAGLGVCHVSPSGQFVLERGAALPPRSDPAPPGRVHHPFFALSERAQAAARHTEAGPLDYLILVPTLRCNLSCSYCQVSRAPVDQPRFDWSAATLGHVLALLDGLEAPSIKIEFQGGEPTLRLDLVRAVIDACGRFAHKQFILCTNLSRLDADLFALLENPDVYVSTSLDGNAATHSAQRTGDAAATDCFLENARTIIARFGPDKLSALPTIDQARPPDPDELIDAYRGLGQSSIYLRPINYQGFARKRHRSANADHAGWWAYYDRFVARLIARNFADRSVVLEESYLSLCLKRIFQIGHDRHVDLRNPNPVGRDYVLVDFDGRVYPTDEARMLSRAGVIDLAIGTVAAGWDTPERALLDRHSTNIGDPACDACAYQPYCGRDLVDDLSRYGTIAVPREETFFCGKHLHMFDLCMRLIHDSDPATRYSLAKWMGLAGEQLPAMVECI